MKKTMFLLSIICFALLCSCLVVIVEANDSVWSRTYGGEREDIAIALVETPEGGYAIAGYTSSFGDGVNQVWLVKTDENGNMEWNQTYDALGLSQAYSIVLTSDGGYALAGTTDAVDGNNEAFLVKTDASGNMEWNRTYGGPDDDFAYSLVATSDGGYALAGTIGTKQGSIAGDFWLVKTDEYGNMEWNQTYEGVGYDVATSLVETSDGGYVIAGETATTIIDFDFWVAKTNASGNVEWSQTYGGPNFERRPKVVASDDGGYVIAGRRFLGAVEDTCSYLVKIDASGSIEWNRTSSVESDKSGFYSLVATSDGGYVAAGVKDGDGWLVKTDSYGNMEWNKTYGYGNCISVIVTSDGGYAIAGNKDNNFWVMKTDEYGVDPYLRPPEICVDSSLNSTHIISNVSLSFTVDEETSWMGYSLDGMDNVTITENEINIIELSEGSHNITVYATDTMGNTGKSETITFAVAKEVDMTPWIITAIAIAAIATVAVFIYYKKRRRASIV